jgi:hypothetical protein
MRERKDKTIMVIVFHRQLSVRIVELLTLLMMDFLFFLEAKIFDNLATLYCIIIVHLLITIV